MLVLMCPLANWWDVQTWLVPVVGLGSAGLALVMGHALLGKKRASDAKPRTPATKKPKHDPFVQGSVKERRAGLRRSGSSVKVLVTDAERKNTPREGWVLDRSTGGLCLAVSEEAAQGSLLSVRPANAAENAPWVQVEVRSCRETDDNWELGCQFVRTPPWSVMLLFG